MCKQWRIQVMAGSQVLYYINIELRNITFPNELYRSSNPCLILWALISKYTVWWQLICCSPLWCIWCGDWLWPLLIAIMSDWLWALKGQFYCPVKCPWSPTGLWMIAIIPGKFFTGDKVLIKENIYLNTDLSGVCGDFWN